MQNAVLNTQRWQTREESRLAIANWIETKYHRKCRQRGLGKLPPIESETIHMSADAARKLSTIGVNQRLGSPSRFLHAQVAQFRSPSHGNPNVGMISATPGLLNARVKRIKTARRRGLRTIHLKCQPIPRQSRE
jgi:hypothetical protein